MYIYVTLCYSVLLITVVSAEPFFPQKSTLREPTRTNSWYICVITMWCHAPPAFPLPSSGSPSGGLAQQKPRHFQVISVMNTGKINKNRDWPSKWYNNNDNNDNNNNIYMENCWSQPCHVEHPTRDPKQIQYQIWGSGVAFDIGEMTMGVDQGSKRLSTILKVTARHLWRGFLQIFNETTITGSWAVDTYAQQFWQTQTGNQGNYTCATCWTTRMSVKCLMLPLNILRYLHPSVSSERSKNQKNQCR